MRLIVALVLAQAANADPAGKPYFPAGLRPPAAPCSVGTRPMPQPVVSDARKDWYSRHLRAAGEPSLAAGRHDAVRFTWLRSFHAPVIVRIEGPATHAPRLVARQLSGQGGYGAGTVARSVERPLTAGEATALRRLVASDVLERDPMACNAMMVDGAQWIVERADRAGYRFIDRQSPDTGAIRALGLAMLALTGWDVGSIY